MIKGNGPILRGAISQGLLNIQYIHDRAYFPFSYQSHIKHGFIILCWFLHNAAQLHISTPTNHPISRGTNSPILPFFRILFPNNHLISRGPLVEEGSEKNHYWG